MYALPGAFTAFLISRTLDKSKNWLLPTLAGSTLMLFDIILYSNSLTLKIYDFSSRLVGRFGYSPTMSTVASGINNGIYGFLAGAVFGIALVLALFFGGYIYQTSLPFLEEDEFDSDEEE